ncbi:cytochrome P450 [Dendrothele bispora CBS 962.96]|uniref:Cytochrome P450 n=1 Tax=Dendrothele bispora (strain CBS 962.96) TaxID=1314807 RepID=A0A4V4HGI8_DENBC|nr:cytochrome P450 [Dendrothele bispora CBS 962.96]
MAFPFDLSPITLGVVGFVVFYTIKFNHEKSKLKHIPTVGYDGIWSSWITVFRWLTNSIEIVEEGYRLYPGAAFKIPTINGWQIILNSTKYVDDIRKASDEELSPDEAIDDVLHIEYSIHPSVGLGSNPYQIDVVRHPLTRNIGAKFGEVQEELEKAVFDHIPLTEDWNEIHAWPAVLEIVTRTANRFLVGAPLCRDPDYRELNINLALSIFKSAFIINLFPKFLHPIVGRIFTERRVAMRRLEKHLTPIIEERLRMKREYGEDWKDKPNDFIQWLMDHEAAGPIASSVEDICARVLIVNFGAIHTTSAFLGALYQLAANPDIIGPLRSEIESIIQKHGRNKNSFGQMRLLDSFLKESVRLSPGGAIGVFRKAMKDFRLSDGTVVPVGTTICAAVWSILRDENIYPGGSDFRPFRFAEMREKGGESTKHQFVNMQPEWMFFGQGRHACPGRFFASIEIKGLLAHLILNYDIKFPNDSRNVPDIVKAWSQAAPNLEARVLFRKRRARVD